MATTCGRFSRTFKCVQLLRKSNDLQEFYITRRNLRGVPPEAKRNLALKLSEINKKHALDSRVNIGFSKIIHSKEIPTVTELQTRRKPTIPAGKVELDEIHEDWKRTMAPHHILGAADHYGIFSDLYRHGFFVPWVVLNIAYDYNEEMVTPVHRGNIIFANEATTVPHVEFESSSSNLWTLILTNPDGNLYEQDAECLHWFVGNIQGNDITSGQEICPYLQPFPAKGSGYQRMVFVLYKQEQHMNYDSLKKLSFSDLRARTFKTFDFYENHQDVLTPAGLAFYQTVWNSSVTDVYHNVLNLKEPSYEYCHKPEYIAPQVQYPEGEPFNVYLDRYRDIEDIRKEVLLKRLKTITPFEEEKPPFKYPNVYKSSSAMPSWLKDDLLKERYRVGKYLDLRPHSVYGYPEIEKPSAVDTEFLEPPKKDIVV